MRFLTTAFYLGQKLKEIRQAKGMSQDDLADRAECSRRTIIQLEKGANVSVQTLFRAMAHLGVSMELVDMREGDRWREALTELQDQAD